jgi:hypothetical protein
MSKHAIEFFQNQQKEFTKWVECPSKFEKKTEEPAVLAKQTKLFLAGSKVDGRFGDDPHTAWSEYQKTMSRPQYKQIMSNTLYPKRARVHSVEPHEKELQDWESKTSPAAL